MPVVFARVRPESFFMLHRVWDFVLLENRKERSQIRCMNMNEPWCKDVL